MLQKINDQERKVAELKCRLNTLKNELKVKESKILVKDKEYWKEVGVTNAEGRKAHIVLELEEYNEEIVFVTNLLIVAEAELKCLEREYEAQMEGDL